MLAKASQPGRLSVQGEASGSNTPMSLGVDHLSDFASASDLMEQAAHGSICRAASVCVVRWIRLELGKHFKEHLVAQFDIADLSLPQLQRLQKGVAKAIAGYNDRKRLAAVAALEERAKEFGFSLAELIGAKPQRKKSGPAVPKYRHPENLNVTWSGRGRQPGWFKASIDAGKSADSLRV